MHDARALLASLVTDRPLVEIDDDIVDLASNVVAHYDAMGWLYDAVCGTTIYNRLVWGTTPDASRAFARSIFESATDGPHVELGCGSLLFTAHLYDELRNRACILIDPSLAMLRLARERLRKRSGRVPPYVALVRGDSRNLPIVRGFATSVLSMHVVHVVHDRQAFLRSLVALARSDAATIGFTSLVRTGSHRDAFLALLHATGELAAPLSVAELSLLAERELPHLPTIDVAGSMAWVTGRSGS